MPFIEIAHAAVKHGFSVIPLEPRGKRPMPGWGATNRTRDLAVVEGWARQFPEANVGICADENVAILESDDIEALRKVVGAGTGYLLPVTLTVPSTLMSCGSSEYRPHFFFKHTTKSRNVGNMAVPGLFEARFSNQYVVGAGSTHPSGAVYRWLNDVPMVEIPDWLVSELLRLARSQKGNNRPQNEVRMVGDRVQTGSRHYFLMREAGRLWDGKKTEEEMLQLLIDLNEQHCEPPREPEHVAQCVRDAMKMDPYDPGPTVVIGSSPPRPNEPTGAEEWQSLSADELIEKKIPPRNPVMSEEGGVLFYEQSVNQILAWRGVGKTNFALGLAGALASAGSLLGFQTGRSRRVLYLDGELPMAQLQERVKGFVAPEYRGAVQLFSPEMLRVPRGLNLVSQKDFDCLMRLVDRHKTEVVFLDSQATLMQGDSNKDDFQEARMNVLRHLRWAGLCVIEMHHVGKTGLQRGISKNDDILDVQMYLRKPPEWEPEDGLEFEVTYEKIRHAAALESGYKVRLVDGKWIKGPADLVAQVGEMVSKGKSFREIGKELKFSRSKAHRLYLKAVKAGLCEASIKLEQEK